MQASVMFQRMIRVKKNYCSSGHKGHFCLKQDPFRNFVHLSHVPHLMRSVDVWLYIDTSCKRLRCEVKKKKEIPPPLFQTSVPTSQDAVIGLHYAAAVVESFRKSCPTPHPV